MTKKDRLSGIVLKKAVLRGDFTLSSGKKSSFYIDLRKVTLDPEGLHVACGMIGDAAAVLRKETGYSANVIAGPSIGADPIVAGVILMERTRVIVTEATAQLRGAPVFGSMVQIPYRGAMIRSAPKDHGTGKQIEGSDLTAADRVILVEDVATSGGSLLRAAEAVRKTGAEVSHAFVILDREEGAEAALATAGIKLHSLLKLSELRMEDAPKE